MIRFVDALVLAHTKLRVHRVRTGIAIAISGLLFGLIAALIIIVQGIFVSVDRFSDEGLNDRTILNVTRSGGEASFNEYLMREDPGFVNEVETAHKALVAKKQAAAKKYGITYTPALEDPSPITIDPQSKKKVVKESDISNTVVQEIAVQKRKAEHIPFDVNKYLEKYPSATVIQELRQVTPADGTLTYMKDGKEKDKVETAPYQLYDSDTPGLNVLEASLTKPFISNTAFDPSKGEVPVIIPYGAAEKLLGFKALGSKATMQQKYDRLQEVRAKIGEVTASYCYRNVASQALLSRAKTQQEEMKAGATEQGYVKPSLIYNATDEKACAAVTVQTDTRSVAQKQSDSQLVLYEKEIGTYLGEPAQQLITVRGVGISSDFETSGQWSMAELIKTIFASSLGYGTWAIPEDLLNELPEAARPAAVFGNRSNADSQNSALFYGYESYLVGFTNKDEARTILGGFGSFASGDVYAMPFGSGVLIVDEFKHVFTQLLIWVFAIIGGIAVAILAGIVGRTVADGRRESSIFRAIGASRLDIGAVYGTYVILLALRIVIFTAVLAIVVALTVEIIFWQDATLGARLSYAASDVTKEFHLFSLTSPYLLWIIGAIFGASILASIIPILLGARRNPIKDMRSE